MKMVAFEAGFGLAVASLTMAVQPAVSSSAVGVAVSAVIDGTADIDTAVTA